MNELLLPASLKAEGQVLVPGSKSISNRILLLAALSTGKTQIHNLLYSEDIDLMLKALTSLGVNIQKNEGCCWVEGGAGAFSKFDSAKEVDIFVGLAGTVVRPLLAALCLGQEGCFVLRGVERMHERPIADLVNVLRQLDADIEYLQKEGFPPLRVRAKGLKGGGKVVISGSLSSQFLTSLLIIAPLLAGGLTICIEGELVSVPYVEITLKCMRAFGVEVQHENYKIFHVSQQLYKAPEHYYVEGDASSASYFFAAGAMDGGNIVVNGIGRQSMQGELAFLDAVESMGALVTRTENSIEVKSSGHLKGIDIDCNHMPDTAMTLAVLALFAKGETIIRNIYTWRLKETDRLSAMSCELRKVGAEVEEGEDYIKIRPSSPYKQALIATYGDHRMAMCFSLISLAQSSITIEDPECVVKTWPDYFSVFSSVAKTC